MKKNNLVKFLLMTLTLSVILTSCSDDEKKGKDNELVIGGLQAPVEQAYITEGYQTEDNEATLGTEFTLAVPSSGVTMVDGDGSANFEGDGYIFYMGLAAATSASLAEGTYTFQGDSRIFPVITWGSLSEMVSDDESYAGSINEGTVTVTKSGSTYTITFDLVLVLDETEITLKGHYKGSLENIQILL